MLTERFLGFINQNKLLAPGRRTLLAVSGGLDSMVMAHLFGRTGLPFAVAHVNFALRGLESDDDARFVQNAAEQYGVPVHLTRFDTLAEAERRGVSIQMVARDLRYDWFAQLLAKHGYAALATAHHQNDVLETLLLNLTRGTGLAGLRGIPIRQGHVIRPLWFATRHELAQYAREHHVAFREDSSNAGDDYVRNRIRHHVVPVLTDLNPNLLQTLAQTVARLRAAETIVRAELDRSWQNVAEKRGDGFFLETNRLLSLPEPEFRLAEWLQPYGFSGDQSAQLFATLRRQTGQEFRSKTHRVTHDRLADGRTGLLVEPRPTPADYEISLPDWPGAPVDVAGRFRLTFSVVACPPDFRPPADPDVACLDADVLTFPLTIRPWRLGDRFQPLGLAGTKLVSDLLNDQKLTRAEREQTAVLLADGQIAWVIGRRIGHRFRVTAETKRLVFIDYRPEPTAG